MKFNFIAHFVFVMLFAEVFSAYAAITPVEKPRIQAEESAPKSIELKEINNQLPSPIKEFVESIENVNQDIQEKARNIDPQNATEDLNSWTQEIFGFTLGEIFGGAMSFVRWTTRTLINLLTWIQSIV